MVAAMCLRLSSWLDAKLGLLPGFSFLLTAVACAGAPLTQRYVDEPQGETYELGAPQNTRYDADVQTSRDLLHLAVYEQSECERILVKVVSRTQETLQGDDVVAREFVGPVQVAEGSDGRVPCHQRYARDVQVALQVGNATYPLGRTDPFGELHTSLSAELKQGLYGESTPATAHLLIERQVVAPVSLAELAKHEQRVEALLPEFEALVGKERLNGEELARAYSLYEQLRALDRADPRIAGLTGRFLESQYGRLEEEASANIARNLAALKDAQAMLATPLVGVPMYVQIGARDGAATADILRWARGEVALGLRDNPSYCRTQSTSTKTSLQQLRPATQFALHYMRFAFDDRLDNQVRTVCTSVQQQ